MSAGEAMLAVLRRELTVGLRRGAPFALLSANAVLLAAFAAAVGALAGTISPWVAPSIGSTSAPAPSGLGPTLVAWRGPALFQLLMVWLALLATLVAPAAGARTLMAERSRGTLGMLIGSGLPLLALVLGKALGALAQVALVLLSGAPAFALVWLFGGIEGRVGLLAAGVLLAWTGFLIVLGMFLGALFHGELLAAAGGAMIGAVLLFPAAAAFGVVVVSGPAAGPATGLALASPFVGMLAANPDLAEAIARTAPGMPTLPLRPTVWLLGTAPLPVWSMLVYGVLGLTLVSVVAVVLDPYHPLRALPRRIERAEALG